MNKIGYCGDNCSDCPRHMATASNNIDRLKEVALMWKRVGWRDTIPNVEEIKCRGCKTVKWCRYNDIRECALARLLNNCGQCHNYPCQKIDAVFEKTASYAKECEKIFSKEDFKILSKAFFNKKQNLDLINKSIKDSK
jgi:hypothetical protein